LVLNLPPTRNGGTSFQQSTTGRGYASNPLHHFSNGFPCCIAAKSEAKLSEPPDIDKLLILDDLGTEKLTDWAAEKLDTLIDHRYIKGLPLVVTTNVPAAQLSPRIASRLQDRRLGRVVTLSGPDYRISGTEGGGK
jgi:hypothetical protein